MSHLTDVERGELAKRVLEVMSRAEKGIIPFQSTMDGLQALIEVVAEKVYNLHDFFVTRSGLRVGCSFSNLILSASKDEATPATFGGFYDLPENMDEGEIRKKLADGYVFNNISSFCAMLAHMFRRQWGGTKDGLLLVNGGANLFFVRVRDEVFVVFVRWHFDNREWLIDARRFVAVRPWIRGDRSFSATAELERAA